MARKILLVEDNELFRGMLRSLLEIRGYSIHGARNGPEGLQMLATERFDAVLTDLDMPGMDGFEFCQRLREQNAASGQSVPVWIMTGTFRPALAKKAAAAGAVLVLRKPFPIEEVCEQLEKEFAREETSGAAGSPPPSQPPPPDAPPAQ